MGRSHECRGPNCPCYKRSFSLTRWLDIRKLKHHQKFSACLVWICVILRAILSCCVMRLLCKPVSKYHEPIAHKRFDHRKSGHGQLIPTWFGVGQESPLSCSRVTVVTIHGIKKTLKYQTKISLLNKYFQCKHMVKMLGQWDHWFTLGTNFTPKILSEKTLWRDWTSKNCIKQCWPPKLESFWVKTMMKSTLV